MRRCTVVRHAALHRTRLGMAGRTRARTGRRTDPRPGAGLAAGDRRTERLGKVDVADDPGGTAGAEVGFRSGRG